MLHKIVLFLSLLTPCSYLWAQVVEVNPDHPQQYTVQEGDTLWDISGRFLVEPWHWPEIWQVNPQIENPHLIFPGDIISLTYDGDRPVLSLRRGSGGGRLVKLSPSVRVNDRSRAVPTIPIEVIRQFLTRPLFINENEMDDAPYIVSSYEQHLVIGPGVDIYVRDLAESDNNQKYSIYRKGPEYVSMVNGSPELLGYEAMYIGEAEVKAYGDPATAVVTDAVREVMVGDHLMPQSSDEVYASFMPTTPDADIQGSIISAQDVLSEIGQYQVVVLDRGADDGVEVGNVFGVYQSGRVVQDKIATSGKKSYDDWGLIEYLGKSQARGEAVTLPNVRAGVIMVFRTFDRVSYALVMEALRPIHLQDAVKAL